MNTKSFLGKEVKVLIDRPLGCHHPEYKDTIYTVNYGYVPGVISGDGEDLDCFILGVDKPLKEFVGECIAIVHRTNDDDDKLILVPKGYNYTNEEIEEKIGFLEKYFEHIIIR